MPKKHPLIKGTFIVLEGIDGCGKSTQIEMLKEQFPADVLLVTHEPQDTGYGARIKKILRGEEKAPQDPLELQKLYVLDRKDHLERVLAPRVQKSAQEVVLCDRYALSTFVYGAASGIPYDAIAELHWDIIGNALLIPTLTIVLDVPVGVALERIRERAGEKPLEYFEKKKEFLQKVRKNYLTFAPRFQATRVIAGYMPPAKVYKAIHHALCDYGILFEEEGGNERRRRR